ncbi:MAG: 4-hydroxy-tetrahydrodipicolinate reductase [Crocinitomicaceae bacterium]|nr:4-hydroxy-tetrahydrodipicolinate reductase [Crocinitomicaceae bacterium]
MNIALIGYGKMGKTIEEIAIQRGHKITGKCSSQHPIDELDFDDIDVAIEFTAPHFAIKHIEHCIDHHTPVIVGTTAWNDQLPYVKDYVTQRNGSLLYASNFSIGVNIFFDLNRRLAELMRNHQDYQPSIDEVHHVQKMDAPSGTAISLANDMMFSNDKFSSWIHQENETPTTQPGQIALTSYREDGVPGTHKIKYESAIDSIEMTHVAHNRQGFALGAVIAAEWIFGKQGIYTMQDVINL